jgi:hypothetical protein
LNKRPTYVHLFWSLKLSASQINNLSGPRNSAYSRESLTHIRHKITLPNLLTMTFLTMCTNSFGSGQGNGEADVATDNLLG